MTRRAIKGLLTAIGVAVAFALGSSVGLAADIRVMSSGGFAEAYRQLVPEFERRTGHKVISIWGASQGNAPDSIPARLARGEPADVIILASGGLDGLIAEGKAKTGSRVDLARSTIGAAVRSGAPKPDISTVAALTKTLLEAKSIAYSASASGTYLSTTLFPKLGIADQISGKSKRIVSERVGIVVARGDAELGFQQVSELLPIAGIDFIGPIPEEVQQVTIFSAGLATSASEVDAAKALIAFLSSRDAAPAVAKTGLEPIATK